MKALVALLETHTNISVQLSFPPGLLSSCMIQGNYRLFFHVALDRFVHTWINDLRDFFILTDLSEMKLPSKLCWLCLQEFKAAPVGLSIDYTRDFHQWKYSLQVYWCWLCAVECIEHWQIQHLDQMELSLFCIVVNCWHWKQSFDKKTC